MLESTEYLSLSRNIIRKCTKVCVECFFQNCIYVQVVALITKYIGQCIKIYCVKTNKIKSVTYYYVTIGTRLLNPQAWLQNRQHTLCLALQ